MKSDTKSRLTELKREADSTLAALDNLKSLLKGLPVEEGRAILSKGIEDVARAARADVAKRKSTASSIFPKDLWIQAVRTEARLYLIYASEMPISREDAWEKARMFRTHGRFHLPVEMFDQVVRETRERINAGELDSDLDNKPKAVLFEQVKRFFDEITASKTPD